MRFDSNYEKVVYEDLVERGHTPIYHPFKKEYILNRTYTPDMLLPNNIVIESKGRHHDFHQTCRNIAAFIRQHPELDIRFLWQSNGKWTQTMRLSDWCKKNNIKCAIGLVPEEWVLEPKKKLPSYVVIKKKE